MSEWPKPIIFRKRIIPKAGCEELSILVTNTINEINLVYDLFRMSTIVGFSGGKDSVVLLDLVIKSGIPHEAHYHVTTIDPPELVHFIRDSFPKVIFDKPRFSMIQLIKKWRIAPTRQVRFCCSELKERKYKGMTILGIRREESVKRKDRNKINLFSKERVVYNPILDWNESHIWEYIEQNKLPYCSLYDVDGISRIGCVGCPLKNRKERERDFIRWPTFKNLYLHAFDNVIEERNKYWDKVDKRNKLYKKRKQFKSGQEMFDWWMNQ